MVSTGPFADRSRILTSALQWQRARCDHECQSGSLSWYRRRRYVKVGGVWSNGAPITTTLLQRSTDAQQGPDAVVRGWVAAIVDYLVQNNLDWDQVRGSAATPGPFRRYGVLDRSANLPVSFAGFDVHATAERRPGRASQAAGSGDCRKRRRYGRCGRGAARTRGDGLGTVVLLAPGSGLGAYIDRHGLPLAGDTLAGMEGGHMPAAARARRQAVSVRLWAHLGLHRGVHHAVRPALLAGRKTRPTPRPRMAHSALSMRERALALRGLAQQGDQPAGEIFDFRPAPWGSMLRTWRWRSIRSSSSSAAA